MNICDFIPKGRENAISRASLAALLNMPDRKVRQCIEAARRQGEIICNAGDGSGYFIADRAEDIQRQLNMNNSRAMSILVQQSHLKRKLDELTSDQVKMEELS